MREDFVSVSLDIDLNEDEAIQAGYARQNSQLDWRKPLRVPVSPERLETRMLYLDEKM